MMIHKPSRKGRNCGPHFPPPSTSPCHTRKQTSEFCKGSKVFPENTHLTPNVDFLSNRFQDSDLKWPTGFLIFFGGGGTIRYWFQVVFSLSINQLCPFLQSVGFPREMQVTSLLCEIALLCIYNLKLRAYSKSGHCNDVGLQPSTMEDSYGRTEL